MVIQYRTVADASDNRFFFVSIIVHFVIIAGSYWAIQSRNLKKPMHLPPTITLVRLPLVEKQVPKAQISPQRVQMAAPQRRNTVPTPPAPIEPARPAAPPAPDINPVPSAAPVKQEALKQAGQTGGDPGGAAGGTTQVTDQGDGEVRIGAGKALDNVNYSPLYNPKPAYPPIAMKAGIQGFVEVDLLINEFGRVESFTVEKVIGHPSFGDQTAKVIGKWRFPPPRVDGKKIKVRYLYTVNFTLD
jgi:periplasmic protein TonB